MKNLGVCLMAAAMLAAGASAILAETDQSFDSRGSPVLAIAELGDNVSDDSDGTVLFVNRTTKIVLECLVFEGCYNLDCLLRTRANTPPELQVIPNGKFEIQPPIVDQGPARKRAVVAATEKLVGYFNNGVYTVLCLSRDFYEGNIVGMDAVSFTARSSAKKVPYHYTNFGKKAERFVNQIMVLPNCDNRRMTNSNTSRKDTNINNLVTNLFQKIGWNN